MIKMNIPVIFQFLKDLSANNNREWFNEHKAEYEIARAEDRKSTRLNSSH